MPRPGEVAASVAHRNVQDGSVGSTLQRSSGNIVATYGLSTKAEIRIDPHTIIV